jgi:hypothetical protein
MKNELLENNAERKYYFTFVVAIGLVCLLIGIFIENSRAILLTSFGIAFLIIAIALSVREKRVSFRTTSFLIIGLFFLASGVTYFIYTKGLFRDLFDLQTVKLDQVSKGLASIGTGFLVSWFKAVQPLIEKEKKNKGIIFTWFCIAALCILLGIYVLVNGFRS